MSGNINEQSPGGAEQGSAGQAENFLGALGKVRRDMVAKERKEDSDDELQLGGGKRKSALSLLSGKKKGTTTLASDGGDDDDVDGAKVAPEQRRAVLDARIAEEGRQRMEKMKLSTSKRIDERSKSTEEDGTDKMVPALEDGGEEAVSQIPGVGGISKAGDHLGTNKTSPEDSARPEDASGPSLNPRASKRQGSIMGAVFGTSQTGSKKLSSSSSHGTDHGSEKTSSTSSTKQFGSSTVSQLFARSGTTDTVAKKRMGMFGIRQGTTVLEDDALFAAAEKEANEKVEERRFYLGRKLKGDDENQTVMADRREQSEYDKEREEAELLGNDEWQLWGQRWREAREGALGYIPVFHPDCNARIIWQVLMVFPLMYMGTVVPYRLAFIDFRIYTGDRYTNLNFDIEKATDGTAWEVTDILLDIFFWMDLVYNFFVAYFDVHGRLNSHPYQIWRNYLGGWFTLDLLACLPASFWSNMITISGDSNANKITRLPQLYRIGRLARLSKMGKVSAVLRKLLSRLNQHSFVFWLSSTLGKSRLANVSKFLMMLLFISHIFGCFWYLTASFHEDPLNTWVGHRSRTRADGEVVYMLEEPPAYQWLTCVYFILTVCTTVGFGDITPYTQAELLFTTALMLFGAVINSVIVSEVIAVLTRVDQSNSELARKTASITNFFKKSSIHDSKIEHKIRLVAEYQTREKYAETQGGREDDWKAFWEICTSMSVPLQRAIAKRAHDGAVWTSQLVKHSKLKDEGIALMLSVFLQKRICPRGFVFYRSGEQAQGLYLIKEGICSFCAVPSDMGGIANIRMVENLVELDTNSGLVRRYPYVLQGKNSYVGEFELIAPGSRKSCLRAETKVEVLMLTRSDFIILCYAFPVILENLRGHARRREERRSWRFKRHTKTWSHENLAASHIQDAWRDIKKRRATSKMKRAFNRVHKLAAQSILGKAKKTALEQSRADLFVEMAKQEEKRKYRGRDPEAPATLSDLHKMTNDMEVVRTQVYELMRMVEQIYFANAGVNAGDIVHPD